MGVALDTDMTTVAALKAYLALAASWTKTTAFYVGAEVAANGNLYRCITAGTSSGSGTGPSGVTADITDGTVHWKWLGPQTTVDNDVLQTLISSCSEFFASYCDRRFDYQTHVYVTSGHGGNRLMLPDYPLVSHAGAFELALTIDGATVPARASVGSAGWVVVGTPGDKRENNELMLDGGNSGSPVYKFTKGIANVTVTYDAGYYMPAMTQAAPSQTVIATLPNDLQQACIETCASWYRRRSRIDEQSKSIQGEVISFSIADVPAAARRVLELYKRNWPRY